MRLRIYAVYVFTCVDAWSLCVGTGVGVYTNRNIYTSVCLFVYRDTLDAELQVQHAFLADRVV